MPKELAHIEPGAMSLAADARAPGCALRVEDGRVCVVFSGAALPGGVSLGELVIHLPHVGFPFDFREGIEQFRQHRGVAWSVELGLDVRALAERAAAAGSSGVAVTSVRVHDDVLVVAGRHGATRFTARARVVPAPERPGEEPALLVSVYGFHVYGVASAPWPTLAGALLDLIPAGLVAERTLTTARVRAVRPALAWCLSGLGWKLPETRGLVTRGVGVQQGRIVAAFSTRDVAHGEVVTLESVADGGARGAFARFVEDLELKRHHPQVDELLAAGALRDAVSEIYRAMDGSPRPGFLAERLVGIAVTQPVLHDEAERVCRALLEVASDDPVALAGLAALSMAQGRPEAAATWLARLGGRFRGAADRDDAVAVDLTIADQLGATDPIEARAALERVLARSPDHEEALSALVPLVERADGPAAVVALHKRLLFSARSPDRARQAGLRLAHEALGRQDYAEAQVYLRLVLEAAPNDAEARVMLATVELEAGRPDEAARILEHALKVAVASEPSQVGAVAQRLAAVLLDACGEPGRARRVLWSAVDAASFDDAEATALAHLALSAGDGPLALRFASQVAPDAPERAQAGCVAARAALMAGDRNQGLEHALGVLEAVPGHEAALALVEEAAAGAEVRERLLFRMRRAAGAVSEPAARARLHRAVARLYESLDLHADAIGPYEVSLDAEPDREAAQAVAHRLLALYGRFGMWPRHQELCERLLATAAGALDRVPLLVRQARAALEELGDAAAARRMLDEAVELSPRRVDAQRLLAEALRVEEDSAALVAVLRRLEALEPGELERGKVALELAGLALQAGAPGEARAVLGRLPAVVATTQAAQLLRERAGLPGQGRPPISGGLARADHAPPLEPRAEVVVTRESPSAAYARALGLADRGELAAARDLLAAIVEADPGQVPARELLRLLTEASQQRVAPPPTAEPPAAPARAFVAAEPPAAEPAAAEPPAVESRVAAALGGALAGLDLDEASQPEIGGSETEQSLPAPVERRIEEGDRIEALLGEALEASARGDVAEAGRLAREVLGLDDHSVEALELCADAARTAGDWATLSGLLERLGDVTFDATETLALSRERAHVITQYMDDAEAAAEAWEQVLSWQPLDPEATRELVSLAEARGDHGGLAALWARRAEAAKSSAEVAASPESLWRVLARARTEEARVRLGPLSDGEGALAAARDGVAVSPDDPELLEMLVRALAATNERVECHEAVERLLPHLIDGPLRDEMLLLRRG
ncbi:MAG: tetratricopeptide repeat protein [Myxococcota bacterium]